MSNETIQIEKLETIYANPEWVNLKVNNPHFNMLYAYDFFVKHNQNEVIIKTHLEQQIETAIAENFIGTGRYDLELITQTDGGTVFSNPSFPDQGLIETAERATKEKQLKKLPPDREIQEKKLAETLTAFYNQGSIGDTCLWTSPPGDKEEYSDQMSITYLGEIQQSKTSPNHKKLHIELLVHKLSIEGHQQLLKRIDNQDHQHQRLDTDFVGTLYKQPTTTIQQLNNMVKQLEKNYTNPEAKPKKYVAETILKNAKPQIREFCLFLETILKETYTANYLQLTQADINNLEKAYSLGYRSVVTYFNKQRVVNAQQMDQDFKGLSLVQKTNQHVYERPYLSQEINALNIYSNTYLNQLNDRYGDLRQRIQVGGGGCPSGQLDNFDPLTSIESLNIYDSIFSNGIEYDFLSNTEKKSDNDIWVCENCGHEHHIDAKNGKLYDKCVKCGKSGRCG